MAKYIERAAAVTVCDKQYRECLRKSDFCGDTVAWNICADIKAIPAADVAPVIHARWVEGKCSNCGVDIPTDDAHDAIFESECRFCYYCGAKMDGGDKRCG